MHAFHLKAIAAATFALVATSLVSEASAAAGEVELDLAGPIVDPDQTASPARYRVPRPTGTSWVASMIPQTWSMLGRADRAAAGGYREYRPSPCNRVAGSPSGWDEVVDAIAERAADHRVVIVNESHVLTCDRETTRRLLERLRPLGFSVLAAETFIHRADGRSPVEEHQELAWPHQNDGYYLIESTFGRLLRDAKALGYRFAPYEEICDAPQSEPRDRVESITQRESAQARHLAHILSRMGPDERLIVHGGYSHASEVPIPVPEETEWMAARLKALTGLDPLTISQTSCGAADGVAYLGEPPAYVRPGQFDMIVAHPSIVFADHRPVWRREAGDIPTPIPPIAAPDRPAARDRSVRLG